MENKDVELKGKFKDGVVYSDIKKIGVEYTLSFYVKENKPYIKHPKWFEFWKKSKLVDNYVWERKICTATAESEEEALKLFDHDNFKEVLKQTHNEVNNLQLEMNENENTNYIKNSEF